MLEVLGDEYISQHVSQAYRDYIEQTSYKMYMSNMVKNVVTLISGQEIETKWSDILDELNGTVTPEKHTETEQEIKTRLLSKLNERGEA
jgi:hypothetical protein